MMFGLRDEFTYIECGDCGCVQIESIPEDIQRYYPPNYYSFGSSGKLKSFLRKQWARDAFEDGTLIGRLLTKLLWDYQAVSALKETQVGRQQSILDVGGGNGQYLHDLRSIGLTNLTGVDPYIEKDSEISGVRIIKAELDQLGEKFDVITLHHSFEHMARPLEVFRALKRNLKKGGKVIVRIPFAQSAAWREFGVNWVALDAPRHFFLHTEASIRLLATQVGFSVIQIKHESTMDQFLGSSQYQAGIPLTARNSYTTNHLRFISPTKQYRGLRRKADELNRTGRGDLVRIVLE
jgi:SAM-dependent methyltransferase